MSKELTIEEKALLSFIFDEQLYKFDFEVDKSNKMAEPKENVQAAEMHLTEKEGDMHSDVSNRSKTELSLRQKEDKPLVENNGYQAEDKAEDSQVSEAEPTLQLNNTEKESEDSKTSSTGALAEVGVSNEELEVHANDQIVEKEFVIGIFEKRMDTIVPKEKLFLNQLLKALKKEFEQVQILNFSAKNAPEVRAVLENIKTKKLLVFGISESDISAEFTYLKLNEVNDTKLVFAPSLTEIAQEKQLKRKLWEAISTF